MYRSSNKFGIIMDYTNFWMPTLNMHILIVLVHVIFVLSSSVDSSFLSSNFESIELNMSVLIGLFGSTVYYP